MKASRTFTDEELLTRLRLGTQFSEAIKQIYGLYFESLADYVMNNNGTFQDAEDVFQEAVLAFTDLVQRDKFRGESSVKTFLFSLNRHIWLNELKKRGRSLEREKKYEDKRELPITDVNALLAEKELREELINLVGQLGENCRKILTMFYYDNLPIKKILESLEYENEQVVRNKKQKCLQQLQKMILERPGLKNILHEQFYK